MIEVNRCAHRNEVHCLVKCSYLQENCVRRGPCVKPHYIFTQKFLAFVPILSKYRQPQQCAYVSLAIFVAVCTTRAFVLLCFFPLPFLFFFGVPPPDAKTLYEEHFCKALSSCQSLLFFQFNSRSLHNFTTTP